MNLLALSETQAQAYHSQLSNQLRFKIAQYANGKLREVARVMARTVHP